MKPIRVLGSGLFPTNIIMMMFEVMYNKAFYHKKLIVSPYLSPVQHNAFTIILQNDITLVRQISRYIFS